MNLSLHNLELRQYRPNWHHGIPRRIAHLLDWAARRVPGKLLSYATIAQIVLGLSAPLGRRSRLVRRIRDDVHRARALLTEKFGRDLITDGTGARATLDGAETFHHRVRSDLHRVERRVRRLRKTLSLVQKQGFDAEAYPEIVAFMPYAERRLAILTQPMHELSAGIETIGLRLPPKRTQLELLGVDEPKQLAA